MLTLQGYAHVYYSQAEDRDFVFAPGCFDWAIEHMHAQRLLYDHQGICRLASRRDGTLELFADDVGLGFKAHIPPRVFASLRLDLRTLGCSFRARRADVRRGIQARHRINASIDELVDLPRGPVVHAAFVTEVTLTPDPAFDGTAVWPAEAGEFDLPVRLRGLRETWRAGYGASLRMPPPPPRRLRPQPTFARAAADVARDNGDMLHLLADWGWTPTEISWIRATRTKATRFGMFAVS